MAPNNSDNQVDAVAQARNSNSLVAQPNSGGIRRHEKMEIRLHILDDKNYIIWKKHTTNVLEARGLMSAVQQEKDQDSDLDKQARALLTSALNDDNQMKVINCLTAYKIWKRLEAIYENKSSFEKENLLNKLHSYKIKSCKEIPGAISEMETISAKLRLLGETVSDESLMSAILRALPKHFQTFITVWRGTAAIERTIENLLTRLMSEVTDNEAEEETKALIAVSKRRGYKGYDNGVKKPNAQGRKKGKCHHCGKPGHWKADCWNLHGKPDGRRSDAEAKALMARYKSTDEPMITQALVASSSKGENKNIWIADCGASSHITMRKDWFSEYEEFNQPRPIYLGDQSTMNALGKGMIKTKQGMIMDVLYVPNASENLFSEASCAQKGVSILTRGSKKVFLNQENEKLFEANLEDGLYSMKFDIILPILRAYKAATMKTWHDILGHAAKDTIKRMASEKLVAGMELIATLDQDCVSCAMAKSTRGPHETRSTAKADKPGSVLHFDTKGPLEASLGGSKYALLCKDEFSGYRQIHTIETKAEIPAQVKLCIARAELETKNKVLKIVSDHGSEFVNKELNNYLGVRGIMVMLSVEYTPEQNGYIERDIRTISETAQAMLLRAKLSSEFWAEAYHTAVYVRNRIPSKGKVTPFELWWGRRPCLSNMYVFGQQAAVNIPQAKRYKNEPRGKIVRFVGYTEVSNTFRFYDEDACKFMTACNPKMINDELTGNEASMQDALDITLDESDDRRDDNQPSNDPEEEGKEAGNETNEQHDTSEDSESFEDANDANIQVKSDDDHDGKKDEEKSSGESRITGSYADGSKHQHALRKTKQHEDVEQIYANIPNELLTRKKVPPELTQTRLRPNPKVTDPFYRAHLAIESNEHDTDPKSFNDAMQRDDSSKWREAMREEIQSLKENDVWELVDPPTDVNIVTCKWVLKIKRKPDGSVDRYRARLVARGFSQVENIDYDPDDIYAPVANTAIIRLLFSYMVREKLKLTKFDVKTAFLHGDLEERIYMQQPEGFEESEDKVWLLRKSLYGLKQAPKQWNVKFTEFLKSQNLEQIEHDECVFYRTDPFLIVFIYVDDGCAMAKSQQVIDDFLNNLKATYPIHIVSANTYLGFQMEPVKGGQILLHQSSYINKMLDRFGMRDSKPADTPIAKVRHQVEDESALLPDIKMYQAAMGSLNHAAIMTRMDIAFATSKAQRKQHSPTEEDWSNVKRIFRYLADKQHYGVLLNNDNSRGIEVYCDSDFSGDEQTSRSTTGLVVTFCGSPIHWRSVRQKKITKSTTEAELQALTTAVEEATWIRKVALSLDMIDDTPIPVYCDNESAVTLSTKTCGLQRTRHFTVMPRWIKEKVDEGEIEVQHIRSGQQLADLLTKPVEAPQFRRNCGALMTALTLLAIMSCITSTSSMIFDRVAPIVWTDAGKYVEKRHVPYNIELRYTSPCPLLDRVLDDGPTRRKRQIQYQHPVFSPYQPTPFQPMQPPTEMDQDELKALNEAKTYCEKTYTDYVLQPLADLKSKTTIGRKTRSVSSVVAGIFFSNVISTILDKFVYGSDHELLEREKLIEEKLGRLNEQANITAIIEMATAESLKSMGHIVRGIAHKLSIFVHTFPQLLLTTQFLAMKMMMRNEAINKLIYGTRRRRLDLYSLTRLLDSDEFADIEDTSAVLRSIESPAVNKIKFSFTGHEIDNSASVFRVDPFRFWANLTGTPTLMEYIGEKYLIYNHTNNCVKAVDISNQLFVNERCQDENGSDRRLSYWQRIYTTEDPFEQQAFTSVKSSLPYSYVYCYRLNITINSETTRCPPFVFRLNYTMAWNTTDYKKERVETVDLDRTLDLLPTSYQVHASHFTGNEHMVDENAAIDRVRKLTQQLKDLNNQNTAVRFSDSIGLTHQQLARVTLPLLSCLIIAILIALVVKHRDDKKHHKAIIEGIYGDKTYEAVLHPRHQVNVNVHAPALPPRETTPDC